MNASMEVMPPGGHETYATSIFSKIKMYLDSNPYGYVSKSGDTMTGNLTAPKFIGALQGNASTASKLGSSNVGSATQPIYLNGGTATACTYTLGKSVPSNAVFTDTKNTAGSTDTSSKIFLIGATSQAANPQTYSQDTAYVGTDGCLYSGGSKVLTAHQDISGKADKSATVSTVTWSNNKLTKTINGTTSDVVSAATILGNLTSSQVTSALGYTPASVNTTYDFESPDDSISFNGRAVGSVVTVDMTVNGKVSTEGDTISGDYVNTADFSEGGVYGKRVTTYGPWGIDVEEYVATSLWSKLSLRDSDILLTKTWDGTHDSLKATIAYLGSQSAVNKVDKAGDTIYGDLSFAGRDVRLQTSGSSSDDSGDIAFYYGNGAEKCRIWTSDGYTAAAGPNYRVYKKDGTALYTGRLATMADLSWGNISGKPSTFPPSSHSHNYLPTAGGTMTGIEYSKYASQSWVNSLTKSAITLTDDIGFGGWICGPTKNGRIAIATYKNGDDVLYIGYGERGRTHNSYTRRMCWNGANGMLTSTVVHGESMLRSSYIGRNDSGDSGYINHVNTGNTAYAPTRASAFTTMSCKHTKTNVVDISEEDALKLLDVRPVNFDYIEEVGGQKNQIGVLAEDTYEVLPKVVSVPDDYVEEDFDISKGIHQPLPSVDYAKFVPYLIKMVQMQQKEIDILKKERT